VIALWFGLFCATLTLFSVLEGWDFGAGALHLIIARNRAERRALIAAIGPLWTWHEVWLVSAGGTLLVAFPRALATAFSGYYLALWLALWLLILRGISLEVSAHFADPLWQSFWDAVFAVSNVLLALVFGAALGNVIRGVPLDESGSFSLALFTNFGVHGQVGLFDWYTSSVALFTLILVGAHGATYLAAVWSRAPQPTPHGSGPLRARADVWARRLWWCFALGFPLITVASWRVRPELFRAALSRPLAGVGMAVVLVALGLLITGRRSNHATRALVGSSGLIVGLLAVLCVSLFPVLLRSTLAPEFSLTAEQAASNPAGLRLALLWWPIAFALSFLYMGFIARAWRSQRPPTRAPSPPRDDQSHTAR
jgi:cytochrome d ubiquinol oxidase subunit II